MNSGDDELFGEAIALPPAARADWLDAKCGADGARRQNLESMLAAHDRAAERGFLSTAAFTAQRRPAEAAGEKIGRYSLLEKIGEGGCGVVFRAEQTEPIRREVALKVIKVGMDTAAIVARFEAERQALALMDHAGIAKVFDAGATESGRPFFVMELVRGTRLTTFCDEQRLGLAARLQLVIAICRAVHHAHQKGVIHRDLKPSNIIVANSEGAPTPKIIDFGIAKAIPTIRERLSEATLLTAHDFLGTPAYMSPEQMDGGSDLDTRTDIYALGAVLFELLTGELPFTAAGRSVEELRQAIREQEPDRPSARVRALPPDRAALIAAQRGTHQAALAAALRGDLDWIVTRCLEKDRSRRYDSAASLALDLERHLAHQPIAAAAPSTGYVLGKWIRRHRLAFAAGAAITLSLVLGLVISTWLFLRERRTLERARYSEQKTVEAFRAALKQQAIAAQERARAGDVHALVTDPATRAAILDELARIYAANGEPAKAEAMRTEARAARAQLRPTRP